MSPSTRESGPDLRDGEAAKSEAGGSSGVHTEREGLRPRYRKATEFPVDFELRERVQRYLGFFFERWWRVKVRGISHVPVAGPVILVGNHSGAIPADAIMLAHCLGRDGHPGPRRVARVLYDRFIEGIPPLAEFYRRCGAVPGRFAVADAMLARGELVVIFPEGVGGVAKLFEERYRLQEFSSSAARLAIRHRAPVVPFAIIGAEEAYPLVARSREAGTALGAPYLPITPFFPAFGPLGVLPLPTKWTMAFGAPIYLHRESRFRSGDDFRAMTERLRSSVASMIERGIAERGSVFLG